MMGGIPQRLTEPQKPTDVNDCPVSHWVSPDTGVGTWFVWRSGWRGTGWFSRADRVAHVTELGAAVLLADALNAQAAAAQTTSAGGYTAHELAGRLLECEPDAVVVVEVDDGVWCDLGGVNPDVFDTDTRRRVPGGRVDGERVVRAAFMSLDDGWLG